ncbi:MAG: tRNA (adenosine(37)-N6)-threonylcarbamoyltransferase complex transferase subunit TsaD, partial [bacterium]|nr:tRNA (adenosine(37)-N6)-threonylcarbamoyltransferase complex transferase subunit TsaD [bacterium]
MKILAIETSCDETAIALVEASGGLRQPNFKILKNLVSSQIKIHRPFGGVVPSLAKREHIKNLPLVLEQVLGKEQIAKRTMEKIDAVAVTVGPGLEPALWTGINFSKDLARHYKKPLLGINHLEGHLYSFLLSPKRDKFYPAIALIVSGGHTILIHQKNLTTWKKIGETRDDAAGEAYDKVARMLNLPYPGGPELEKLALDGNPSAVEFPRPMIYQKNYDFSFSG